MLDLRAFGEHSQSNKHVELEGETGMQFVSLFVSLFVCHLPLDFSMCCVLDDQDNRTHNLVHRFSMSSCQRVAQQLRPSKFLSRICSETPAARTSSDW